MAEIIVDSDFSQEPENEIEEIYKEEENLNENIDDEYLIDTEETIEQTDEDENIDDGFLIDTEDIPEIPIIDEEIDRVDDSIESNVERVEEMPISVYVKRDENKSIISIQSSIFLADTDGWELIDEWQEGQDRYIYAHVSNGEYVREKYGNPLYDEQGRPNYYDDFLLWTDEEKEELYPMIEYSDQKDELEDLKERQLILENALQDMILMTMKGGE